MGLSLGILCSSILDAREGVVRQKQTHTYINTHTHTHATTLGGSVAWGGLELL